MNEEKKKPEEQRPMEDAKSVVQGFQDEEARKGQEAAKAARKMALAARLAVF